MTPRGLVFVLCVLPLCAQYQPGQGRPRLPIPGRSSKSGSDSKGDRLTETSGVLQQIDDKSLVMQAEDTRFLIYRLTDKTKFLGKSAEIKPSEMHAGDKVRVESTQDDEGSMTAVNVHWNGPSAKPPQPAATATTQAAAQDEGPPDTGHVQLPPNKADDANRPRLARGAPPKQTKKAEAEEVAVAANPATPASTASNSAAVAVPVAEPTKPAVPVEDPIEKAREAAASYTSSLPNYICKETMTRYMSDTPKTDWKPQDLVSMDLVYDDGKESYQKVAVNGKETHKGVEALSGAWSTGEFGTMLMDLYSPGTAAKFHYRGQETIAQARALVYEFEVDQPHSHWSVHMPSQMVLPAYKGRVWIDKDTFHTLRIEQQAVNMPAEFPLDTVESAVDYENIRIEAGTFLLPVHAETLACQRGTSFCSRNTIDFRNYRKFTGKSDIIFH